MIGLVFLFAIISWIVFTVYLTVQIPRWIGLPGRRKLLLRCVLVPALILGPFIDEVIGMRQFRALCDERTAITVSPDASTVKRAASSFSDEVALTGYVINVKTSKRTFIDLDTNKPFLSYETFRTTGGRVAGLALLGGWHSCSAEHIDNKNHQQLSALKAYELLSNGRKK